VAGLPEHYRQVALLFYMEDKSYDEVSAMLNLPLGTVKTYLHRARLQLAEAATIMERGS
jgi:RNA polymerase sigma-70 factor (ECF subfamily)